MKNILLCCNSMGIGGVETVILNQVIAFTKKGYKTYVIAEKGEYSDKVKELGGTFIEVDFPEGNDINQAKIKQIVDIIEEKNITEIHIHKYQCIPYVLIAAFITKTPYFAYEHGIKDTKKYYTWRYPIYKSLFPIYFKNAYKIIAITPKVAEVTRKEYGIEEEKYAIIHNGIDFNSYRNPNHSNSLDNIYIVSRIDEEKMPTIYNGIEVFKQIMKINENAKLYIVGGGNAEKKLIDYLNNIGLTNTNTDEVATVKLLGKQTNIYENLKNADVLLGVGRCVLEAIAMKIPAVITGYEGINGLVTTENMYKVMEENFSGVNMPTITSEECLKALLKLKENKNKIVDEVYKIAIDNLDCYKNYINIPENEKINIDWFQLFDTLKENRDLIEEQSNDIKLKYDWIQKIEKENETIKEENNKLFKMNDEINNKNRNLMEMNEKTSRDLIEKERKVDELKLELYGVYHSKRWRYTEKLSSIFNKIISKCKIKKKNNDI